MKEAFNLTKIHEWRYIGDGFSVLINCHQLGDRWIWKLYVAITERHSLYGVSEGFTHIMPLHGGCTYDRVISEVDNQDWDEKSRRPYSYRKIGCDYAHFGDDLYENLDPNLGLPFYIENDAKNLYEFILERSK